MDFLAILKNVISLDAIMTIIFSVLGAFEFSFLRKKSKESSLASNLLRISTSIAENEFVQTKLREYIDEASARYGRGKGEPNKELKHNFVFEKIKKMLPYIDDKDINSMIVGACRGLKRGIGTTK